MATFTKHIQSQTLSAAPNEKEITVLVAQAINYKFNGTTATASQVITAQVLLGKAFVCLSLLRDECNVTSKINL